MTAKAPGSCVRCDEPSVAFFTHRIHGEVPVCLTHAEELLGGPVEHDCPSIPGSRSVS